MDVGVKVDREELNHLDSVPLDRVLCVFRGSKTQACTSRSGWTLKPHQSVHFDRLPAYAEQRLKSSCISQNYSFDPYGT